ncbi:hypothetical protein QR680_001178 [Steinernema hermaphroditum]|uniref:Uncharacterized protein n=1 Tax=Steinernema hermaphroditum TaxID=289476 RepID=A0AA39GZ59_9BILA|nr:hypothetical protein QR680_001178 [Steinernema hermaphroditum]
MFSWESSSPFHFSSTYKHLATLFFLLHPVTTFESPLSSHSSSPRCTMMKPSSVKPSTIEKCEIAKKTICPRSFRRGFRVSSRLITSCCANLSICFHI